MPQEGDPVEYSVCNANELKDPLALDCVTSRKKGEVPHDITHSPCCPIPRRGKPPKTTREGTFKDLSQ